MAEAQYPSAERKAIFDHMLQVFDQDLEKMNIIRLPAYVSSRTDHSWDDLRAVYDNQKSIADGFMSRRLPDDHEFPLGQDMGITLEGRAEDLNELGAALMPQEGAADADKGIVEYLVKRYEDFVLWTIGRRLEVDVVVTRRQPDRGAEGQAEAE